MMTREEFLEAYNAEGEAEALLTQYDLEQAQEKIDGYIGNYSDMEDYVKIFPDYADKYGAYLNYEKMDNHILKGGLFSIEHKNKVYLFRR